MNYNKLFEYAKEKGINDSSITFIKTKETSIKIFHNEIESYSISNQSSVSFKGIYNNQLASVATEDITDKSIPYLVNSVIDIASKLEKKETPVIFKGSEKYTKKSYYNKELSLIPIDEKIKVLYEIEKEAYNASEYVKEVQVYYGEEDETRELQNSFGLKLKAKTNDFYVYLSVVCKKGDEVKSGGDQIVSNDFNKLNVKEFVSKIVEDTVKTFDGVSIDASTYKCVLNESTTSSLLQALINTGFSAENIQKKSSILVGKLNEKVFSSNITVQERPLEKTCWLRYFDDEGVRTYNKTLIEKGVIKEFIYNLEAAGRENKESTGNGFNGSIGTKNLYLKPGRLSEEELINKCENGIYITDISGLHSGLNRESGDFSLVANGFIIKDGKISSPLKLLTIGGNIYKMFNNCLGVASNSKINPNSVNCPSILVKNIKVSSM